MDTWIRGYGWKWPLAGRETRKKIPRLRRSCSANRIVLVLFGLALAQKIAATATSAPLLAASVHIHANLAHNHKHTHTPTRTVGAHMHCWTNPKTQRETDSNARSVAKNQNKARRQRQRRPHQYMHTARRTRTMHISHTHTLACCPTLFTLSIKSKTHFAAPKNQTTPKSMEHPNPQTTDEVVFGLGNCVVVCFADWVAKNCSYRA